MSEQRLAALRSRIAQAELDGLLVSSPANRRYISGFTGSAGLLLITAQRAALLSDFRYRTQGAQEAPACEFHMVHQTNAYGALLAELVPAWGLRRLGFEAAPMSYLEYRRLCDWLKAVELVPTEGIVEELRQSKDRAEIELLRRAIAITDEALAATLPLIRPTMRERELAWELEKAMRERGAEGVAFEIIVAAGPNGARPHARAGDDLLGTGRPVVIDCGARYKGYHADMTRTFILGEADEQFERIYRIVLEAQERAERNIKAGISGNAADALARDYIAEQGYGEAFGHSLGHGVGLEIHEGPWLRRGVETPVPAGAVVSVEPGIYLEDWGGVRIEDLVLVGDEGVEILTGSPKQHPVIPC
ncbi:MAG: peptidase M24 [Herpetosiphonaceae bacterium]|nr:MAG: peptidase M24 [Herpetosiphonaceae bacterium]